MSNTAFIKIKQQLSSINTLLKQGKLYAAVNSLHEVLGFFLRTNLLKHEKQEFEQQIEWAVYQLGHDQELKKVFPLLISYQPGEEKKLNNTINELLSTLQAEKSKEASQQLEEWKNRKQRDLEKAQAALDSKEYDKARYLFSKLCKEFKEDMELRADVGERFLNAGLYDEAIDYLKAAYEDNPKSPHVFNKLGMALRRSKNFEEAERFYRQALSTSPNDEYILFNLGRVYIDWRQWKNVEQTALRALEINPGFVEAQKMLKFARKYV
ncbi:tetratricopeptide repeat protein [Desulfoplanes sp.]